MGNRKLRLRSKKRPKRFLGVAGASSAAAEHCSESEDEGSVSASRRKLDLGLPSWINLDSENSSSTDDASSSPSHSHSSCSNDSSGESSSESSSEPESGSSDDAEASANPAETGYRLVYMDCLQTIFDGCVCKFCRVGDIVVRETTRAGLASVVSVSCTNDQCTVVSEYPLVPKSNQYFYDCNRRSVLAARVIGRGHSGLSKFCGVMNLPPPVSKPAFHRHQRILYSAAKSVAETCMEEAAAEVRAFNITQDRDEHVTSVTFDGTWMKRGFTSLHGVFTAISWDTGRILDLQVSSKHCHRCNLWRERREHNVISAETYQAWMDSHSEHCSINTERSAPGMESEAAVLLWNRSIAKTKLEYHVFIGDGDSKSFAAVCEAKPYGPDVAIAKEECVGHVQKRVGSNLRNLKKSLKNEKLADGRPIGGQGRLTDPLIDTLQTYYGNAIRSHPNDLHGMAKAIWASLFHRASTDQAPQHMFCPEGDGSWCGWQLVQAGVKDSYEHHNVIPAAVVDAIKPLYRRLTERDLLLRCLRGATQNQNEAFNGMIWSLSPKTSFCGAAVVEIASWLALCQFNKGSITLMHVLSKMGCDQGHFTEEFLAQQDAKRVSAAERKVKVAEKMRRKQRRRRRKGLEEQILDLEGPTYAAGAF